MNVLVVGALGLIGAATVKHLREQNVNVVAVDSQPGEIWTSGWKRRAESLRLKTVLDSCLEMHRFDPGLEFSRLRALLEKHKPEAILNIGGNSLASEFSNRGNLLGETMTRLNQALVVEAESLRLKYVYVSSSMVYGDFTADPQPEDGFDLRPKDPYGALKLGCESLIQAISHQNPEFNYAIVRPSAVYGALDTNERILVKILHKHAERAPLFIRDASERLDFTHVDDLARMLGQVVSEGDLIRDTYNVTNGEAVSLAEALDVFQDVLDSQFEFSQQIEEDVVRPVRGSLDMTKFDRRFGGHPSRTIDNGIRDLISESSALGLI